MLHARYLQNVRQSLLNVEEVICFADQQRKQRHHCGSPRGMMVPKLEGWTPLEGRRANAGGGSEEDQARNTE